MVVGWGWGNEDRGIKVSGRVAPYCAAHV